MTQRSIRPCFIRIKEAEDTENLATISCRLSNFAKVVKNKRAQGRKDFFSRPTLRAIDMEALKQPAIVRKKIVLQEILQ